MDKQYVPRDTLKYQVYDLSKPVSAERLQGGQAVYKVQVYQLSLTRNA